jgi:hypothetical protein
LAGKAATDDIDRSDLPAGEFPDILIAGHLRPVFSQHPPAEWANLAKRDSLEPARALKPKVETAYASEQGKDAELRHPANPGCGGISSSSRMTRALSLTASRSLITRPASGK